MAFLYVRLRRRGEHKSTTMWFRPALLTSVLALMSTVLFIAGWHPYNLVLGALLATLACIFWRDFYEAKRNEGT